MLLATHRTPCNSRNESQTRDDVVASHICQALPQPRPAPAPPPSAAGDSAKPAASSPISPRRRGHAAREGAPENVSGSSPSRLVIPGTAAPQACQAAADCRHAPRPRRWRRCRWRPLESTSANDANTRPGLRVAAAGVPRPAAAAVSLGACIARGHESLCSVGAIVFVTPPTAPSRVVSPLYLNLQVQSAQIRWGVQTGMARSVSRTCLMSSGCQATIVPETT